MFWFTKGFDQNLISQSRSFSVFLVSMTLCLFPFPFKSWACQILSCLPLFPFSSFQLPYLSACSGFFSLSFPFLLFSILTYHKVSLCLFCSRSICISANWTGSHGTQFPAASSIIQSWVWYLPRTKGKDSKVVLILMFFHGYAF